MDFQDNSRLRLAYDFVQYTGTNLFLTGKAGTGKTTFLKFLRENSPKRMVVVAPTGVAAINAGGVTIHSFFQLSLGPQLPEEFISKKEEGKVYRFRKNKIDIIKSLDLLVIDEISMVRADLLDGIDKVLRKYRNSNRPFGGVQLLMIGDLQQLSPVVKEDEWGLLKEYYQTPYFFSSRALLKTDYVTIELQHVYRQKDEKFIGLLNKIRDNIADATTLEALNKRYIPDFDSEKEGYIILTTHNYKADKINNERLQKLESDKQKYKAVVSGSFPDYAFPTESDLELKVGAQVMFVKNDPSPEKRFYNGKIGTVIELGKRMVKVLGEEDDEPVEVTPLVWEKVKYEIDKDTKEIKEDVEGMFTQIPLKLAWAITIHKSQGLTFDKVIIDAGQAFAHGQVYVALSRCRSLEGIVLKTPLTPGSIKQDLTVKHFSDYFQENQPEKKHLEAARKTYERDLLLNLFNFERLQKQLFYLVKISNEYANVLQDNPLKKLKEFNEQFSKEVSGVAKKFEKQLTFLLSSQENEASLQERIGKGAVYFEKKLDELVIRPVEKLTYETDNTEVENKLKEGLQKMYAEAHFKKKCLQACKSGFNVKDYLDVKAKALVEEVVLRKQKTGDVREDIPHPELYSRLKAWRNVTADEEEKLVYMVLPLKSMADICKKLPVSTPALKEVKGFGKKKIERYGEEVIRIVSDYCDEMGIKPPVFVEKPPEKKKPDTKVVSFQLWKEGNTLEQIAEKRGLVRSTVAGHLAQFIAEGKIDVFDLVDKEKVAKITDQFKKSDSKSLKDIREALGEEFSYEELRFVLNHLLYLEEI